MTSKCKTCRHDEKEHVYHIKLKTLKDLGFQTLGHRKAVFKKELKAEAIKWQLEEIEHHKKGFCTC